MELAVYNLDKADPIAPVQIEDSAGILVLCAGQIGKRTEHLTVAGHEGVLRHGGEVLSAYDMPFNHREIAAIGMRSGKQVAGIVLGRVEFIQPRPHHGKAALHTLRADPALAW